MYRKTITFFIVLIGFGFCFINCEGRITKKQALKKSLAEFKTAQDFTKIDFHPINYNAIVTDTLLSNGYEVRLKIFSTTEHTRLNSKNIKKAEEKPPYRILKSEIIVSYEDKQIFKDTIHKGFISEILSDGLRSWPAYNLKDIWVDQAASLDENLVAIKLSFCSESSDQCNNYNLQINKLGEPYLMEI